MKSLLLCVVLLLSASCRAQDDQISLCDCGSSAEFPGGQQAFVQYINAHIQLTPGMLGFLAENSRIYVSFVVTKNGTIEDARIERGICNELDGQVLGAILAMPQWKPYETGCGHFQDLVHHVVIRICVF